MRRNLDGAVDYDELTSYDSSGRVNQITYPSGFGIKHIYNANGYLSELRDAASNFLYWTANAQDADGNITQQTFGNGVIGNRSFSAQTGRLSSLQTGTGGVVQDLAYQYDAIGNVRQRQDNNQSLTETFAYDNRNRVTQTTLGAGNTTYTYDDLGNLTTKSDVGTYTYGGTKPHAVSSITGLGSYTYDNNGNLTSGGGKTLTWASYDLPLTITKSGATSTFQYDANRARFTQSLVTGSINKTITYIGSRYEKHTAEAAAEHRHYLRAGDLTVAIHSTFSAGGPQTRYLHRDHIGSVDGITNEIGGSPRSSRMTRTASAGSPPGSPAPQSPRRPAATPGTSTWTTWG